MKQRALMLLMLAVGALVQQILPPVPLFGGVKPPIMAALALYYALRRNRNDMWLAIFVAALLSDGLDLGSFGPALLAFPVIGILAHRVRNEVFSDGIVSLLFFGAATGVFTTFVTILVYSFSGQRPVPFSMALLRLVGSFCLGMITLPLVTLAINKLEAALPKRRGYGWQ
jgi:rod shape-determining protein MreD